MQTFDWIVVGNGLTGAALSYELSRQGLSVLLLDRSMHPLVPLAIATAASRTGQGAPT
jgi:glycine/D-amino acid oxidase-like deaminating enzyme